MPNVRLPFSLVALALLLTNGRVATAAPRVHDGLYLRLGLGGGAAIGTLSPVGDKDSASLGANVATEIAVGWTVRRRLVLGIGTFPMIVPKPSYDGVDAGGQHVSGTGPFATYYSHETGGLHVQGGLLFAGGYLDGSAQRPAKVGFGYGGMLGVGWDVFVTDEWSLGALARLTAYRLSGVEKAIRIISPALLATATFH